MVWVMLYGACTQVPQAIRKTLEGKCLCAPRTTVGRFRNKSSGSTSHEDKIAKMLSRHGKAHQPLIFLSGDNYQRLYNAVASASAVDPSKDSAHVVFTSAIKTGDVRPEHDGDMIRPTLSNDIRDDTHFVTVGVNPTIFFEDVPLGACNTHDADLFFLKHSVFAPKGRYYHKKHFREATAKEQARTKCSHVMRVPPARQCGCHFNVEILSAMREKIKCVIDNEFSYNEYMLKLLRSKSLEFNPSSERLKSRSMTFRSWVADVHQTRRGHANLTDATGEVVYMHIYIYRLHVHDHACTHTHTRACMHPLM